MKVLFLALTMLMANSGWTKIPITRAFEAPTKKCDPETLELCFQTRSEANHAFEMVHRAADGSIQRTKRVALLIHGLSDSPYFYRDIAQILFRQGLNVLAIRTTGHGTDKSHLAEINRKRWYEDMQYGMEEAKKLGDEVILAGMSLGGALVLREALINPEVKGLMFFSGAFKLPKGFNNACRMENPLQRPFIKLLARASGKDTADYQARKEFGVDIRYQGIHNNGTCELIKINKEIVRLAKEKIKKGEELFSHLDIPVFNVVSEYDTAIDIPFVSALSKNVKSNERGLSHLLIYTNPNAAPGLTSESKVTVRKTVPCMRHASVLLKPSEGMGYSEAKCEFTSPEEIVRFNSEQKYDFTPEINFEFELLQERLEAFLEQLDR
jgi:esterase/lipase